MEGHGDRFQATGALGDATACDVCMQEDPAIGPGEFDGPRYSVEAAIVKGDCFAFDRIGAGSSDLSGEERRDVIDHGMDLDGIPGVPGLAAPLFRAYERSLWFKWAQSLLS